MRKEEELKRLLTETEMLSKQSELIKHDVCLSSLTAQLSSLQLKISTANCEILIMKVEELNQREFSVNSKLSDVKRVIFDMDHHTKEEIAIATHWKDYVVDARSQHEHKLQNQVSDAKTAADSYKVTQASLVSKKQQIAKISVTDEAKKRVLTAAIHKLETEERKQHVLRNLSHFLNHFNVKDVDKGIQKYTQMMNSNDILTDKVAVLTQEIQKLIGLKKSKNSKNERSLVYSLESRESMNRDISYVNYPILRRSASLAIGIDRKENLVNEIMTAVKFLNDKIDKLDFLHQLGPGTNVKSYEFPQVKGLDLFLFKSPAALLLLETKLIKAQVIIFQAFYGFHMPKNQIRWINNHPYLNSSSVRFESTCDLNQKSSYKEQQARMTNIYNAHFPKTRILSKTKTNESIKDILSAAVCVEFKAIRAASQTHKINRRRSLDTVQETNELANINLDPDILNSTRSGNYDFQSDFPSRDLESCSSTRNLPTLSRNFYSRRNSLLKGAASTSKYKEQDKQLGLPEIEKSLKQLVSSYNSIKREKLKNQESLQHTVQEISRKRLQFISSTPKFHSVESKSTFSRPRNSSQQKLTQLPHLNFEKTSTQPTTRSDSRISPSISIHNSSRKMPDFVLRLKSLT